MKFDNPLEAFCEAVKGAGGRVVFLSEQAGTAPEGGQSALQAGTATEKGLPTQQEGAVPEEDLPAQQNGAESQGGLPTQQEGTATLKNLSIVAGAAIREVADEFRVKGSFGVAENGAVWIEALPEGATRRDLFIHETLIISLDKTQIVNNMHEAYRRLGEKSDGYGLFISGPSKTADIEQALVFGAHGPRELCIELL